MAQLFQPTNITPDTRGSFGNGVVTIDNGYVVVSDNITISWQVNGNTPMTAFQIDFTDMEGNSLYSTGKRTEKCPFYGVSQSGDLNLFSYTIANIYPDTSFLRQASEGLMRITQYWGTNANNSIVQQSPSHYIVRPKLTAWFEPRIGNITSRSQTFTAYFNGDTTDGLMWMRWVLTRRDSGQVVADTGRLYGNVDPTFTYDGFLPGKYTLSITAETSAGVLSVPTSGTDDINVVYNMSDTGIPVTASRDCNGESAVSVRWSRLQNIPLAAGSGMTDNGDAIVLANEESYLIWDKVNGNVMDLPTPWTAVWSGSVTPLSGRLFMIMTESGRYYEAGVSISAAGVGQLYIESGDEEGVDRYYSIEAEWDSGSLSCVLTQGAMYWKISESKGNDLYPKEALLPSESLFPGGLGGNTTGYYTMDLEGSGFPDFDDIVSVTLYGPSSVYSFEILDHTVANAEAQSLLVSPNSAYNFESLFYIKPEGSEQDYNAGNYPEVLQDWTKIELYRTKVGSGILNFVGKTTVGDSSYDNQILDYAARSQQGPYTYHMYILSSDKYLNTPSISNEVNPCFWNWAVLSCTENADGSYSVQSTYLFGKNLQSGSMTNNNQPGVFKNFTPYPTVMIAPQNYRGGTLQSLIGVISGGVYSDTINLRDEIYALSTTTNTLFLKNRKGDLFRIRPSGEISMETMDNTREQAQTVNFPWAEVGDATGVAIYSTGGAS